MNEIQEKKFKVEKVVYYNSQKLWGVIGLEPIDSLDGLEVELLNMWGSISACGSFEKPFENAEVVISGDIIVNPQYGKQISVKSLSILHDTSSKEGIINYLAKDKIEGIGVQLAEKIYEMFGDDSIDIVLNHTDRLKEVNGIGKKTVKKVKESLDFLKQYEFTIKYLTQLGLTYGTIMKLIEEFGDETKSVVENNPYEILEVAKDFSFKQVDEIYLKAGGDPISPVRLKTAFLHLLKQQAMMEGSTGCVRSDLSKKFYSLLDISGAEDYFANTMEALETDGKIELGGGIYVYYKEYLDIEKSIAQKIKSLQQCYMPNASIKDEIIEQEIASFPFSLNKQQIKAIYDGVNTNVYVLTGPAGCVDGDTEYFNGERWVPIRDFKRGDKVLQYNQDGTAELVTPIRYIKDKADLWHLHNISGNIDQVLSDNHRFIYLTTKGNINEKPFGEVRKILNEKGSFSAFLINSFSVNYEIPVDLTPERLRLMIAVSADGSLVKSGKYWIVRLKKERKKVRMRELIVLNKLDIKERIHADGYSSFNIPFEYGCKEFPLYFYFLPKELKKVFNEEIFLWDGSIKNGKRNVKIYFSTIKKNADIVQFILSQNGHMVNISIDDRVGRAHSVGDYLYKSVNYRVSQTKWTKVSLQRGNRELKERGGKGIKIEKFTPSDGCQYCFEVPSGMLVLRRNNRIFITGNSGKSSITKALYRIYFRSGYNVELLSPTAKACRRLEECTGGIAQTIHKFLGIKREDDMEKDFSRDYVKDTVLIIDEASMMDIILFNKLLKGATMSTRVILVGDNNQLPSVQAGNVLGDTMDSKNVNVTQLTDIMRQQENSNIIKYCSMINNGEVFEPCECADFLYEEFGTGAELKEKFLPLYKKEIEEVGLNEVQVITPYKKGELGMTNLNIMLQQEINASGKVTLENFRLGDKVRHTQNNYKKEVFNGETGVVAKFDEVFGELEVDYGDRYVSYNHTDINELTLSYCSTVHASQGSEYKVVFVILDDTSVNNFLHIRRLLYTAVSRGKSKVYILTKPYLVDRCIENNSYRPRITKLKEFLQEVK